MADGGSMAYSELGKRRAPEFVYFVQAEKLKLIKIGIASNMTRRLCALQCGSPDKLKVLGVIRCDNAAEIEAFIHEQFKHMRSHGEWFHDFPALLGTIAELALPLEAGRAAHIELLARKIQA